MATSKDLLKEYVSTMNRQGEINQIRDFLKWYIALDVYDLNKKIDGLVESVLLFRALTEAQRALYHSRVIDLQNSLINTHAKTITIAGIKAAMKRNDIEFLVLKPREVNHEIKKHLMFAKNDCTQMFSTMCPVGRKISKYLTKEDVCWFCEKEDEPLKHDVKVSIAGEGYRSLGN